MILYRFVCWDCETLNHIHWDFRLRNEYGAPCCCECGQEEKNRYEFKGSFEIEEERKNDN